VSTCPAPCSSPTMGSCITSCVFLPPRQAYPRTSLPAGCSEMVFTAHGSRIPVCFFRASRSGDVNSVLTVLVSHGNAEDLRTGAPFGRAMATAWNCNGACVQEFSIMCEGGLLAGLGCWVLAVLGPALG
jgi:hypothetical protein